LGIIAIGDGAQVCKERLILSKVPELQNYTWRLHPDTAMFLDFICTLNHPVYTVKQNRVKKGEEGGIPSPIPSENEASQIMALLE